MYTGKTNPVPIPTEGGRVVITKNGYIYWITKSRWDNSKKRTIDNRTSIGHIDPDHKGMMFPGYNYFLLNLDKKQEEIKSKDESTGIADICTDSALSDHSNASEKEGITYSAADADRDIVFSGRFRKH